MTLMPPRIAVLFTVSLVLILVTFTLIYDIAMDTPRLPVQSFYRHQSSWRISPFSLAISSRLSKFKVLPVKKPCTNSTICPILNDYELYPCIVGSSEPRHNCSGMLTSALIDSANAVKRELMVSPSSTPVAVILEGRSYGWDLETLTLLLENAVASVPSNWVIHAFLRRQAIHALMKEPWFVANTRLVAKIKLHELPDQFKLDKPTYNHLLSQPLFWSYFAPASHVHLFELDTGYCAHSEKTLMDFTQYDYCGARWKYSCRSNQSDPTRCVGNSGFSIWSRFMMEELTKKYKMPDNPASDADALIDQYWGDQMRAHWPNVRICPPEEADFLSVETVFDVSKRPIGFHKPFFSLWSAEQQASFVNACPSYKLLLSHRDPRAHTGSATTDATTTTTTSSS